MGVLDAPWQLSATGKRGNPGLTGSLGYAGKRG